MYYPIAIEYGVPNQGYGVVVPDITGCYLMADTLEEVIAQAKLAIEEHLRCLMKMNEQIPLASCVSDHITNGKYKGFVWHEVAINLGEVAGNILKINISLPSKLVAEIDQAIQGNKKYESRSEFIAESAFISIMKKM